MNRFNPDRWSHLWQTATHAAAPTGCFEQLLAMYAQPHRHYHNHQHIGESLNAFDQVRKLATEPAAVEFAIWLHDAVYDPRAGDNEERSADLAQTWLQTAAASEGLMVSVRRLILATKFHDGTLHPDAPLLVDIDLSILGHPPERFWKYEEQIRAEYLWVDNVTFAAKRSEILDRFLARPRLYQTEALFQRFENQAQANLRESISRLRHLHAG